jgi:multidrug efflux system membrane fusion protein
MRTSSPLVAIIAAGALASACSQPQAAQPKPAQTVKTHVVTEAPPPPGVRYSASIEPFEQVALSFKATGYVDDVLRRSGADGKLRTAQAGDRVTKGTVLARVREAEYRERVTQGQAKLAEGEASLVKARLDMDRARTLFAADSLTKPDLDAAQASFDAAEARMTAARADIELALTALRDCALVAPATGIILERRIEPGALASGGTVGFVLGDLQSVKARFGIPDGMIQSVRLGDPINVTVETAAAGTFAGRVTAIAPTADPQSRVFDVEVTIPNQDGQLRPGMIGTVALGRRGGTLQAARRAPTVPLTAIVRSTAGAGQFAVLVVERRNATDVARMRRVELGEVMGNEIAVLEGLAPGEQVVVSGATLLVDGEPVRVLHQ